MTNLASYTETYIKAMTFDIETACKQHTIFDFYGAHSNCLKLNSMVIEALEDPDDGYRSYCGAIILRTDPGGFFNQPLARVRVCNNILGATDRSNGLWYLHDVEDGHVWLTIGTDNSDGYYPFFVFTYTPKLVLP